MTLEAGESKRVQFTLPAAQLAFYDVSSKTFVVEPGMFDVMIGSSSDDIRLREHLQISSAHEATRP